MNSLEAALESLKLLSTGEKVSYSQIAKEFGCNRSLLSRSHRGIQGTRAQKNENERLLTNLQEKELIKYVDKLTARGIPLTRAMIRNFVGKIAQREPVFAPMDQLSHQL